MTQIEKLTDLSRGAESVSERRMDRNVLGDRTISYTDRDGRLRRISALTAFDDTDHRAHGAATDLWKSLRGRSKRVVHPGMVLPAKQGMSRREALRWLAVGATTGTLLGAMPDAEANWDPKEFLDGGLKPFRKALKQFKIKVVYEDLKKGEGLAHWDQDRSAIVFDLNAIDKFIQANDRMGSRFFSVVAYHEVHHAIFARLMQEAYGDRWYRKIGSLWEAMVEDNEELANLILKPYEDNVTRGGGKMTDQWRFYESTRAFGEFLHIGSTSEFFMGMGGWHIQSDALKRLKKMVENEDLVFRKSVKKKLKQIVDFILGKLGKVPPPEKQTDGMKKMAQIAYTVNMVMNSGGTIDDPKTDPTNMRYSEIEKRQKEKRKAREAIEDKRREQWWKERDAAEAEWEEKQREWWRKEMERRFELDPAYKKKIQDWEAGLDMTQIDWEVTMGRQMRKAQNYEYKKGFNYPDEEFTFRDFDYDKTDHYWESKVAHLESLL